MTQSLYINTKLNWIYSPIATERRNEGKQARGQCVSRFIVAHDTFVTFHTVAIPIVIHVVCQIVFVLRVMLLYDQIATILCACMNLT